MILLLEINAHDINTEKPFHKETFYISTWAPIRWSTKWLILGHWPTHDPGEVNSLLWVSTYSIYKMKKLN